MAEEETTALKTEIARLNRVVDTLVSFNQRLTAENAYLRSLLEPQNLTYTILKSQDGITNHSDATVNSDIGTTNNTYSNVKSDNGITKHSEGIESSDNRITNSGYSIPKSENGITKRSGGTESFDSGITKHSAGTVSFEDGISTVSAALPVTIALTPEHAQRLAGNLKSLGFVRLSARTLLSVAKIMLHLYNNGDGSHETFRKTTGLSKGGLAKLIISLKKRGVITRTGYRQFQLTAHVRQIVGHLFA